MTPFKTFKPLALCALLAASGGAQAQQNTHPNQPGYIHPGILQNIHTCGAVNCTTPQSSGSAGSGGYYRPSYTVGHTVLRRYGSAAVGVQQRHSNDNTGNLGQIYTAVSHSREAADREALGECSRYGGKNCTVIARVANACTNINRAYGFVSGEDDMYPTPTRFYVSPYVTPQELPDNNGNSLQGGVERRVKETARAACDADAARNKHACEHSGTTLCAWDVVESLTR